jgi:hypothetical protein
MKIFLDDLEFDAQLQRQPMQLILAPLSGARLWLPQAYHSGQSRRLVRSMVRTGQRDWREGWGSGKGRAFGDCWKGYLRATEYWRQSIF